MIVALGSGKGGTGKTTVSCALAESLKDDPLAGPVLLADCDVEEPNAHLFLRPVITDRRPVNMLIPAFDENHCDYCGECARFCRFNALAVSPGVAMVFPELCHSCGGCFLVCPVPGALKKLSREIGVIEKGHSGSLGFTRGLLRVGETLATPLVGELRKTLPDSGTVILDAPPGTSCSFVETVQGSDFCLLVTEPTPFGIHDLERAIEVTELLNVPRGVLINRSGNEDGELEKVLARRGVEILMRISHDRAVAEAATEGRTLLDVHPDLVPRFQSLYRTISQRVMEAKP
ncbi:MAG: 4Fe-4S binding protein [Gemmatimonadales bacterium]|nr:4Fe-4S binding protein [Gemmatimonadales bacterium]